MSSEDRPHLALTDPRMIRAIAHPVRMALIEAMEQTESRTITATQASELLGESPANCAFHLRTLAKYGFVEEAGGGRGRERPWRAEVPHPGAQAAVAGPGEPAGRGSRRHGMDRPVAGPGQGPAQAGARLPRRVAGSRDRVGAKVLHLTAAEAVAAGQRHARAVGPVPGPGRRPVAAPAGQPAVRGAGVRLPGRRAAWLGQRLTCGAGCSAQAPGRAHLPGRPDPVRARGQRAVAGHGHLGQAAHRQQQRGRPGVLRVHLRHLPGPADRAAGGPGAPPPAADHRQPGHRRAGLPAAAGRRVPAVAGLPGHVRLRRGEQPAQQRADRAAAATAAGGPARPRPTRPTSWPRPGCTWSPRCSAPACWSGPARGR